jgi:hypothetical protein
MKYHPNIVDELFTLEPWKLILEPWRLTLLPWRLILKL